MLGVKIRPHRSLFYLIILLLCFLLIYLFNVKNSSRKEKRLVDDDDEEIHLIDLFNHAYQLTYQAGEYIRLFKNTKSSWTNVFKKKSFKDLKSEPVTMADLLSHSILTKGLRNKFPNLQVKFLFFRSAFFVFQGIFLKIISEEKDSINAREIELIKEELHAKDQTTDIPFIRDDRHFTVPLSSVAVWIDPLDATKEFTGSSRDLSE